MSHEVIVTGAAGVIGRAVVRVLREAGRSVLPLVRRLDDRAPDGAIAVDLGADDLAPHLSASAWVFHTAAVVPSSGHADDEVGAARTSTMDRAVLQAAVDRAARPVYFSGTSLYDRRSPAFKVESDPLVALSPYLEAKRAGDNAFSNAPGGVVLRISGPVGPGVSARTVLPRWVQAAKDDQVLEVWGSGRREQDFVHCTDIARACQAVIATDSTGVFNIAAGKPRSMADLAGRIVRLVGAGAVVVGGHPDPEDDSTARFSIDRAQSVLGWSPTISLDDMISDLAACG